MTVTHCVDLRNTERSVCQLAHEMFQASPTIGGTESPRGAAFGGASSGVCAFAYLGGAKPRSSVGVG